jgi:hypothetical protein
MKKVTRVLLIFSVLLGGCCTESSLPRDESPPEDAKVFFHLADDAYVRSYAGRHYRVDGGYQVEGTILGRGSFPEKFGRMIPDSEIVSIGIEELNVAGTALELVIAALIVAMVVTPWPGPSFGF